MAVTDLTRLQGAQLTHSTNASNVIPVQMDKQVAELQPNHSPFISFLMKLPTDKVLAMEFNHLEDDVIGNSSAATAQVAAGGTTLAVTAGDGVKFIAGDILHIPSTGENVLVTARSTDDLTIVRAYGTVSAAIIPAAETVYRVGSSAVENAGTRTLRSTVPAKITNYCQDFQWAFGTSDIKEATMHYYGKGDRSRQRKMALIDHKRELETAMILGQKKSDSSTYRYATGGLLSWISTNIDNIGGQPLTDKALIDWVQSVSANAKGQLFALCSDNFLSAVALLAKNSGILRANQSTKVYGVNVTKLVTPHGTVGLINEKGTLTGSTYGYYAALFDIESVRMRVLSGIGSTRLHKDMQARGTHGWVDEWRTVAGFQLKNEKSCAVLKNFTY